MTNDASFARRIYSDDLTFFRTHKTRRLRIRPYVRGEFGFDAAATLFGQDPMGRTREVDTVIVRPLGGDLKRMVFPLNGLRIHDSDEAIGAFLIGYGVDPSTLDDRKGTP